LSIVKRSAEELADMSNKPLENRASRADSIVDQSLFAMPQSNIAKKARPPQTEGIHMNENQFASLLGHAALKVWSQLPREAQERPFAAAVDDTFIANSLAEFLHDLHPKTARHISKFKGPFERMVLFFGAQATLRHLVVARADRYRRATY
jgi:hypothetical protein